MRLQGGARGKGRRTVAALLRGEVRLGGGVAQHEVPLQVLLLAEGTCAHRTAVLPQADVHAAHVLLQLAGRRQDQRAPGAGVAQPALAHHLLSVADDRRYCPVVVGTGAGVNACVDLFSGKYWNWRLQIGFQLKGCAAAGGSWRLL